MADAAPLLAAGLPLIGLLWWGLLTAAGLAGSAQAGLLTLQLTGAAHQRQS
jgi:hypothetical protein